MSWIRRFFVWLRQMTGTGGVLCDTCKYDYGNVCTRPERPNAKRCPDYKHK